MSALFLLLNCGHLKFSATRGPQITVFHPSETIKMPYSCGLAAPQFQRFAVPNHASLTLTFLDGYHMARTFFSQRRSAPSEQGDALNMARHREHIHRLRHNRLIPMLLHKRQITRQGRSVTGHIDNALRLYLSNCR